jgi:hypothetical protein
MSRLEELKANPIVWSLLNKYKEHEHLIPALLRGEISQNSNRGKTRNGRFTTCCSGMLISPVCLGRRD